jgi:hypothetical protein
LKLPIVNSFTSSFGFTYKNFCPATTRHPSPMTQNP